MCLIKEESGEFNSKHLLSIGVTKHRQGFTFFMFKIRFYKEIDINKNE